MNRALLALLFIRCAGPVVGQSPGGFGTNLRAWYKANATTYTTTSPLASCTNGQTVMQWNDQTANVFNLSQATSSQRPTWRDGSASVYFNYNPSIQFTDHYLQRAAPGILANATAYGQLNLYALYYDYNANDFDWLLHAGGSNGLTRVSLSMNWAGAPVFDCDVPSTANRVSPNTSAQLPAARTNIIAVKSDAGGIYGGGEANKVQAFCNGAAGPSNLVRTSITQGNFPTQIGDNELVLTDAVNYPFTGELAELFLYTGSVTQAIHQRIESYLALKYSARLFGHDYFNSAGTNVFVNSGAYANGVIGIIRDDSQGLYQRQSRQSDDSTRVFLGTLATTNAGNAATFAGDQRSVVIGHNGGAMRTAGTTTDDIPSGQGIFSRVDREWKVTNTGHTGTFNMSFRLRTSVIIPADLRLLVDNDGDFTNSTMHGTASGLTFTYSGGVVTVTGISTAMIPTGSTRYITIVSVASTTPLPVELVLFEAQATEPGAVALTWATASESSNDHFELERSHDAVLFDRIATVPGVGNSQALNNYAYTDLAPGLGVVYYRLKQVDLDLSYVYSDVRAVELLDNIPFSAHPNPTSDVVRLTGIAPEQYGNLMLFSSTGAQLPVQALTSSGSLDMSGFPIGVYLLRVGDRSVRILKE